MTADRAGTGMPAYDDSVWELALAVNAAFKGILGAQGQSGHICARADGVRVELPVERGWDEVVATIAGHEPLDLGPGDVVVLADKVVAAALGRIGPRAVLLEPDPKTVPPAALDDLARRWQAELGFEVTPAHLLLADEYPGGRSTLGTDDPNRRAAELAEALAERRGTAVDVVISDTDTGLDTRRPLIGVLTLGATPVGATAGVNLYEAMRCAVAAEFVRGHTRRVPIVLCRPADRRRRRDAIGRHRGYPGLLAAEQEETIGHA